MVISRLPVDSSYLAIPDKSIDAVIQTSYGNVMYSELLNFIMHGFTLLSKMNLQRNMFKSQGYETMFRVKKDFIEGLTAVFKQVKN